MKAMFATKISMLQHVCVVPLARATRHRSFTVSASASTTGTPSRNLTVSSPTSSSRAPHQSYRGKQLHHLIYKRKAKEIQDFSHLPQAFRNDLIEAGWKIGRSPIYHTVTAADGTVKVGCPLRCSFCATGKGGYSRNLQRHEIIEQVLAIEDIFKHRVTNVVFMGMGEPMLNLKSVLDAHRCLNKDVQIGQRMITISTVGVPNTIKKLASHKLQSTLAVSLHAPNQKLREMIVPSAKSYPLDAIMKDCRDYFAETSRRVSFEYALLAGVNDSVEQARELAELLHEWGRGYHVNLIPFNPIEGSEYRRPNKKTVSAFAGALESRKITVSIRQTRGLDASAACGQLRNNFQKSPLIIESDREESQSDVAVAC
ncbi:hypothetical protein Goshw_014050 [Gossypium schwendimanii]|uniref:Radical SAM core domain-containing protein n=1 Tax=Gossypium schwendimanii TaxID=34291 RepID=A0A7J9M3W0_GOSSC|nr:hypothetical protein [Gossypium schwendimanii]